MAAGGDCARTTKWTSAPKGKKVVSANIVTPVLANVSGTIRLMLFGLQARLGCSHPRRSLAATARRLGLHYGWRFHGITPEKRDFRKLTWFQYPRFPKIRLRR